MSYDRQYILNHFACSLKILFYCITHFIFLYFSFCLMKFIFEILRISLHTSSNFIKLRIIIIRWLAVYIFCIKSKFLCH